jgi:hypothetical protein
MFQDRFQDHIGLMDSGSAAGMTKRVAEKKCHPELVSESISELDFKTDSGSLQPYSVRAGSGMTSWQ